MNEAHRQKLWDILAPARRVFVAGAKAFPHGLLDLAEAFSEGSWLANKEVVYAAVPGFEHPLPRAPKGRVETFFHYGGMGGAAEYRFVPMQYRRLWDRVLHDEFDVALIGATADRNGTLRFGLGVDFQPAAMASSRQVVLEVEHGAPFVDDAPTPALDNVAAVLDRVVLDRAARAGVPRALTGPIGADVSSREGARTAPTRGMVEGDPESENTAGEDSVGEDSVGENTAGDDVPRRIGRHVASLVRDGDCLQLGVGAIPNAVLAALLDHRDLGLHSGLITEGVMALHQAGVLNGRRKSIDRHRLIAGFVLGSRALEEWAGETSELGLRSVDTTHDPRVIAQLDCFVAINSAVEVDLLGQINAESVNGRQISGTGGSVDFMRGAALSAGGRSIVVLPATARRGTVSRIVGNLKPGTPVTALRTDVDFVVTEYGVAALSGVDRRERRARLTALADPRFRDALERE